ncbi:hypothetical protein EYZ11_010463 [Aspergillus tanneri]|uniref:Uncharacterized protein n=1 Tax=Aspergillus tanneri TaxID=1220188 RepID=A0A4V3UN70_9EURO|nr:hypothetical protein EYZ11_010463 [Aspergillus tanneri]
MRTARRSTGQARFSQREIEANPYMMDDGCHREIEARKHEELWDENLHQHLLGS